LLIRGCCHRYHSSIRRQDSPMIDSGITPVDQTPKVRGKKRVRCDHMSSWCIQESYNTCLMCLLHLLVYSLCPTNLVDNLECPVNFPPNVCKDLRVFCCRISGKSEGRIERGGHKFSWKTCRGFADFRASYGPNKSLNDTTGASLLSRWRHRGPPQQAR